MEAIDTVTLEIHRQVWKAGTAFDSGVSFLCLTNL